MYVNLPTPTTCKRKRAASQTVSQSVSHSVRVAALMCYICMYWVFVRIYLLVQIWSYVYMYIQVYKHIYIIMWTFHCANNQMEELTSTQLEPIALKLYTIMCIYINTYINIYRHITLLSTLCACDLLSSALSLQISFNFHYCSVFAMPTTTTILLCDAPLLASPRVRVQLHLYMRSFI